MKRYITIEGQRFSMSCFFDVKDGRYRTGFRKDKRHGRPYDFIAETGVDEPDAGEKIHAAYTAYNNRKNKAK